MSKREISSSLKEACMSRTIEVVMYQEDDQWVAQALNAEASSFGATAHWRKETPSPTGEGAGGEVAAT
jgi:hypothetical protein